MPYKMKQYNDIKCINFEMLAMLKRFFKYISTNFVHFEEKISLFIMLPVVGEKVRHNTSNISYIFQVIFILQLFIN